MLKFDDTSSDDQIAKLHEKEEEEFLQIMSKKYGIPYADLSGVPVDTTAVGLIKEDLARAALIAPFEIANKKLKVALFSPTQANTKEVLTSLAERGYNIEQYLVSHASLEKVWERYHEISGATKSEAGMVDISGDDMEGLVKKFNTLEDVTKALKTTVTEKTARHISNIFSTVMAGAIGIHASDIHIEPAEDSIHIRYRIDGVLHEVATLPSEIYRLFSSRLKLLAGLKLNVGTESQDGRFSIKISGMEIEMRVSVIPGAYGEGVVMRILNPQSLDVTLEDLGMSPRLLEIIDREIKKPHGMILNTGPTGSGKTTTLYAFLKRIYSSEIKMMTIEDPIEYHLKGVSQTQVETEKGYTFLEGLRSAMRQDPDVIMIGEIRDGETAKVAIPKVIGSSLTVALAQRLARKLCDECKKEDTPNEREQKIIDEVSALIKEKVGETVQTKKVWRAVGCVKCNNTGYRGRVGIFEAVLMTAEIESLLDAIPSEREIREIAKKQGLLNMREDGIEKILAGATAFDEVGRVVDLEREG
ncbi:MAG: hypothetical protein UW25_C0004G0284 [Candidatus Nomurabacteria bacterium GW2011_GWB1_44_12]|uniref:Bacterial type II secretion system protein E domain-containing protein n=1 Tax=Candidatus Nomurabacteria bacterium GW2011_GWB1_44_12 TaxID=1618748 RepID=A0A837IBC7_9BACT|nr:MAG: hypothetical protein UW25_C0004G0284 [Candidatus Nomurabacteria bacterium GW2011_GWB1_44_12]